MTSMTNMTSIISDICNRKEIDANDFVKSTIKDSLTTYYCDNNNMNVVMLEQLHDQIYKEMYCKHCHKHNPDIVDFDDYNYVHYNCPMICLNGHKIEEVIPMFLSSSNQDDPKFDHVYYCVEGCEVTHSDVYAGINASNYYCKYT